MRPVDRVALAVPLSHLHVNVVIPKAYFINLNFGLGKMRGFPGNWVKGPGVPWADDFAVLYRSFAEWAAMVWALVVSSADRPINVREAQCSASRGKLFGVTNLW